MKILERLIALFTLVLLFAVGLLLAIVAPTYADPPIISPADTNPPVFPSNPLTAPADGSTIATFTPIFDWADASDPEGSAISYTLIITTSASPTTTTSVIITNSIYTPVFALPNSGYTWTVQAQDEAGNMSSEVAPYSFIIAVAANSELYLPIILKPETPVCPTGSSATFNVIPFEGPRADHPDYLHGDLNLNLRGYTLTTATLGLVDYSGGSDSGAPQLAGIFEPNRFPGISAVYRVNDWNWACGLHGCPGPPLTNFPVTLAGLVITPGEPIFIPERSANIWNDYKAMVLYAEEQRITFGYTRRDTVANGYAVHLENICVDPNLLALYRAQTDTGGWHVTGHLPALRNNQALGTALSGEIKVVIRDKGAFMDPRSRKDWWRGY
jgi:hypothetical protein